MSLGRGRGGGPTRWTTKPPPPPPPHPPPNVMGHTDGASPNMLRLDLLPPEILHHIFSGLGPRDLGRLPRTCRVFHNHVKGNQQLCKDIYLKTFDTPAVSDLDWERELHDFVRLSTLCADAKVKEKSHELPFVCETVDRLLKHASPTGETQNDSGTHASSRNAAAVARLFREEPARLAFLCRSFIFECAQHRERPKIMPLPPSESHQMSAKLHCLYGRPIFNCGRTRSTRLYPFAWSKVYDMRQYTRRTKWGPFMDDDTGRVDWEKVEAIIIVIGSNIRSQNLVAKVFSDLWERSFAGSWSGSYIPAPNRGIRDLDLQDPYGVAGTWLRVVCFIDYNDFWRFNDLDGADLHPVPREVARPPLDVGEATRVIIVKVHVTSVQPPGDDDGKDLPVVHFEGISRSIDDTWDANTSSDIRGTVRLTKEGAVRWTTFSIFNGQPRWRSEGIQIGGVGSARGVLGNWFAEDYNRAGPCGPTAYFKVSDRASNPESDDRQISFHDFLPIMDFHANLASDEDDDEDFVVGEWGEDEEDEDMEDEDEREAIAQDLAALAAAEVDMIDAVLSG